MRNKKQNKPRIALKNNMLNYFGKQAHWGRISSFNIFFFLNKLTNIPYNFAVIFGEMYKYTVCLKSDLNHTIILCQLILQNISRERIMETSAEICIFLI